VTAAGLLLAFWSKFSTGFHHDSAHLQPARLEPRRSQQPAYRAIAGAARHNLIPRGLDFESLRWSPTGRPFKGVPAP
jgi:hypothetical protein